MDWIDYERLDLNRGSERERNDSTEDRKARSGVIIAMNNYTTWCGVSNAGFLSESRWFWPNK